MPATGREILTSRSYTTDAQGRTTGTRRWRTEATSRAEATAYLTGQSVTIGSTHPDVAGISLDSFSYEPQVDGTYDVIGNYSSNNLYVLENVNKKNLPSAPYFRMNFSTYDYTIDVPYGVRVTLNIPNATPASQKVWTANSTKVYKTDVLLTIEVRPAKLTLTQVATIAKETHRVHRFSIDGGANDWLFMGGNVRNMTDTEDVVTYQWQRDSGDPDWVASTSPSLTAGKLSYNPLRDSGNAATVWFPYVARPPHSRWFMRQNPDDNTLQPLFTTIFPYTLNASGYSSLPGISAVPSL